ncbi:MAG: TonB-dependent receptor [Acetobacter aceti]|uniref:TonB-dependent receptor-like beta-barrel domain-containing protein n=1 Tax=Acetobacter aceti TaxID=435 RepID=A0A1U9KJ00_ACEAC|nr:TonB-dependent receptor [Acetobacter aceti]AQS85736.1 hypothetical protein A0U92_14230 [Acetobacter aceti]
MALLFPDRHNERDGDLRPQRLALHQHYPALPLCFSFLVGRPSTDLSFAKARYQARNLASYGIDGHHVTNAPSFVWSFGIIADHGPWYGGLQVRWPGGYPLVEDNSLRSKGYQEVNLNISYRFTKTLKLEASVFNAHAYAAQYAYDYRLRPASAAQSGATGHPIKPISARSAVQYGV